MNSMNHPERHEIAVNAFNIDNHPIFLMFWNRKHELTFDLYNEAEFIQAVDAIEDTKWQELVELGVAEKL